MGIFSKIFWDLIFAIVTVLPHPLNVTFKVLDLLDPIYDRLAIDPIKRGAVLRVHVRQNPFEPSSLGRKPFHPF
jgi:hypothetical protein